MKVQGEFKFLGVEKRQGFKDPSQTFMSLALLRDWILFAAMWMRRHMAGIPVLNLIPM
ncbi:hypothetical protein ACP5WL_29105 [Enterocloster bolteae]|uniref:hypothetical protein n=1 Tax=Enterocloster bolteae TaxID=208479 RepID=UPI0040682725